MRARWPRSKLTVIALLLMAVLVIGGTVYQAANGIYAAQKEVFGSWLIWLVGILPLPGMLLAAPCCSSTCWRPPFSACATAGAAPACC